MNKLYKQYAEIKAEIKKLGNEAKEMEAKIFEDLSAVEGNKLITDFATFSLVYRPKWKYTDELLEKEKLVKDQIKIMKKEEEVKGVAEKISDNGSLRCQLKNKEDK